MAPFLCSVVSGPKQGNQQRCCQTLWHAPCMEPWEDTAPWVGSTSVVYSWRERVKLLRGRAAAAHVVCLVYCVLCIVCLLAYSINFYYLANQLVEINRYKVQISKLCSTVNKSHHDNTQILLVLDVRAWNDSYRSDIPSHWCKSCTAGKKWSKKCTPKSRI